MTAPKAVASAESFAEELFKLACSLHGNPRVIAKAIKKRDAKTRRAGFRKAIRAAAEVADNQEHSCWEGGCCLDKRGLVEDIRALAEPPK